MRKIFLCLSLVSLFSVATFGQNKKVVTNFDLEKYRLQRVQADADYERLVESGKLPSKTELDKREQERQKIISDFSARAVAARNQTENYWQSQAYALRTEIAAIEAETNYVRARIGEIPQPQVYYSTGFLPYGGYNNCCYGNVNGYPRFPRNGRNNIQINNNQVGGGLSVHNGSVNATINGSYGQTTVQQNSNFGIVGGALNNPQTNLGFGGIPYQSGILAAPFALQTSENYAREELISRLRSLEQQRAGLYARFEALQDAAQQQGVNIN